MVDQDLGLDIHPARALVTEATSGIGLAVAMELAGEGFELIAHGRDIARGAQIVEETERTGGRGRLAAVDLGDPADVQRLADAPGDIEVLVNSGGCSWFGPTADLDVDTFDALFATSSTRSIKEKTT
jgi:short-subunit dehydrogenase